MPSFRRVSMVGAVAVLALFTSGCLWITRASVNLEGNAPNGDSVEPVLSTDGRYVAFSSVADDLVPGDGNGFSDVFVRDLQEQVTTRVSVDQGGGDGNGRSVGPSMSANGRYVAFVSSSSDLVSNDGNASYDVFVRDLHTQSTIRASVDLSGNDADGNSNAVSLSDDGGHLVFNSDASDLVDNDEDGRPDLFIRDLTAETTSMVPESTDAALADISRDGNLVMFSSDSSTILPGDDNMNLDVFVHDMQADATTLVSADPRGNFGAGGALGWDMSPDGRFVVFSSTINNLVPNDANPVSDIFVRDLQTSTTTIVTVDPNGGAADWGTGDPAAISDDGRYVVFRSQAGNLVPGDNRINRNYDVFVRDLATGTTTLASANTVGRPAVPNYNVFLAATDISGNGRYVAFPHVAKNLAGPANAMSSIFVRAVQEPKVDTITPSAIARGTTRTLIITGSNFAPDATVRAYTGVPGDVTVDNVNVLSPGEITVDVTVAASAPIGPLLLAVIVPGPGPAAVEGSGTLCVTCPSIT